MKRITLMLTVLMLLIATPVLAEKITIEYPRDGNWPTAFVDRDNDGKIEFIMEIDPWNLKSARGIQKMSYNPKTNTIEFFSNLSEEILEDPTSWVHGYPEVYFGNKPWNGNMADGMGIELPMNVTKLNHFLVHLKYSVKVFDKALPLNFAMETWLTKEKFRSNGVFSGEVEIMVWFYYQNINPAGKKIGEVTVPIIINGSLTNAIFEVWIEDNMGNGWQYMAFRIRTPMKSAELVVDPILFVESAKNFSRIDMDSLYIEDWEIGTEFGGPTTTEARFSWVIKSLTAYYGKIKPITEKQDKITITPNFPAAVLLYSKAKIYIL